MAFGSLPHHISLGGWHPLACDVTKCNGIAVPLGGPFKLVTGLNDEKFFRSTLPFEDGTHADLSAATERGYRPSAASARFKAGWADVVETLVQLNTSAVELDDVSHYLPRGGSRFTSANGMMREYA